MSAVYTLSKTSADWYGAVTDLCRKPEDEASALLRATANGEVLVSPDRKFEKDCLSREDGVLHLLSDVGTRGVILAPSPETESACELRLNVLASAADWKLGFRILREAIDHGVIVTAAEEETVLTAERFTDARALEQQARSWARDQPAIAAQLDRSAASSDGQSQVKKAMLPLMGRALMLTREELDLSSEQLEADLVDRARRYATAYEASLMSFPGPGGQPVYIANFPHFATLIPKQAQALTCHGEAGQVIDTFAPLSVVLELLGDRVEDAGEFHFFPAVEFASEPELVETMERRQGDIDARPANRDVSPNIRQMIFSRKTTGDESADDPEFTVEDWAFLETIPTMLFLLVGGADGSINQGKIDAFAGLLDRASRAAGKSQEGDVLTRVFESAQKDIGGTLQRLTSSITSPGFYADKLGKLRLLLDRKLPESDADKAKAAFLELAKKIALSSGRMFGAKVSAEEKAAVNLVRQTLGVPS